jgi:hypothetical protein
MGKPSQGILDPDASIRTDARVTEFQVAVGRYLRAEYDLERLIPARLLELLQHFERSERRGLLSTSTRRIDRFCDRKATPDNF